MPKSRHFRKNENGTKNKIIFQSFIYSIQLLSIEHMFCRTYIPFAMYRLHVIKVFLFFFFFFLLPSFLLYTSAHTHTNVFNCAIVCHGNEFNTHYNYKVLTCFESIKSEYLYSSHTYTHTYTAPKEW